MKNTTLIIITITLILSACAPPPTLAPTETPAPPTQTPLPPTPDLDAILPSELSGEYILTTENHEIFYLQDKDENDIPQISIDISGNTYFGQDKTPVNLEIKNGHLFIAQDDKILIFDEKEWLSLPKNLPGNLPDGYIFSNPNENPENLIGAKITDAQGKPLFAYFQRDGVEEGEWIKDYPFVPEINNYKQCQVPEEEMLDGTFLRWLESIAITLKFDPEKVIDVDFGFIGNTLGYNITNAPQFGTQEKNPFDNSVVFCYTETTNNDGEVLPYAVMPVFFWDRETEDVYPVIVVFAGYNPMDKENPFNIQEDFDAWKEQNITLIVASDQLPFGKGTDPLVAPTFEKYDMEAIFTEVYLEQNASKLSQKGMIFLTIIANWGEKLY
ncbi:MAG: hypothetical protein GY755_04010 [Chloroflexi bacterium]|nr:hypothetical protein [Chloroflexota bacterium]